MGYVRKRSVPSLVAGSAFSLLYASSSYLMANNLENGVQIAAVASLLLSISMGRRALKAGAAIPTVMSIAGILSTAYYGRKWYQEVYGL